MATNGTAVHAAEEAKPLVTTEPPIGHLFRSPEVQAALAEAIKQLPELISANITSSQKTTRWTTSWLLGWVGFIVLVVVGSVTALTFAGKLSSDALAFTIGGLVTATFVLVRDFFPKGT